ncbi:MAG TPA: TonB C-terminal domain-containing protein [Myxococcota bacterium]|nr:TonB C-terminal domain-containing protein [Myxococcota bacterium]
MRDGQQDLRKREFRRFVSWSAGAHLAVLGIVVISPGFHSRFDASQVIAVDLVSLPASALAPSVAPALPPPPSAKPVPPAEKAPPPPPESPKPKEVVLPKNPEREPSKPKPAPKPQEVAPKPEKDLDDLLADMRKDAGETAPAPKPVEQAAVPAPSATASAGTVKVSPEVLAWMRKAKLHVRSAWVVPPGFRREALETHVTVELDASGAVVGEPKITQRSGNPWYDEGVLHAIVKASPLPPPPAAGEWDFVFLPEDAAL